MTIARLIQRTQEGDMQAAETLLQAHLAELRRLARAILGDSAEADEAVQDALIAAMAGLDSYRGESAFKTWLYSITINACRKRMRKRQARQRLFHALQSIFRMGAGPAHPEDILIHREGTAAVRAAVQALDEKHRLPIILFYQQELSITEIAAALDLPQGTVLSRLHNAREKLRDRLQDQLDLAAEER